MKRFFLIMIVVSSLSAFLLLGCAAEETPEFVNEYAIGDYAATEEFINELQADVQGIRHLIVRDDAPEGSYIDPEPPVTGHDDTLEIPFGDLPPRGGIHNPVWQVCTIYGRPILPIHAIHSMEHGAVWITYHPDLEKEEVNKLMELTIDETHFLMSPYPNLRSPIVLTAWGVQLEVDSADDVRLAEFMDAFVEGPQTVEKGASCSTGTTKTVGYDENQ